jgi:hypothetical protein
VKVWTPLAKLKTLLEIWLNSNERTVVCPTAPLIVAFAPPIPVIVAPTKIPVGAPFTKARSVPSIVADAMPPAKLVVDRCVTESKLEVCTTEATLSPTLPAKGKGPPWIAPAPL